MKKAFVILLVTALLGCWSCKKNELSYFDSTYSALNIWFGSNGAVSDSLTFNFAYTVLSRDSVMFNARLTGVPADHDRTFRLKAVEGDIDKVDIVFQDYVLKAGEYEKQYPLYINIPDGFNEFKNRSGHVVLELEETGEFLPGAEETNSIHLVFKNFLAKPDDWDSAVYPYMALSRYFGTYSDVKYAFIIQTTGYSNFHVYYTMSADALPEGDISYSFATFLAQKCKSALAEYNTTHDTPLRDEFGFDVIFP